MSRASLVPTPALQLGVAGFGKLVRDYYVPALRTLNGVSLAVVVDPLESSRKVARAFFPEITILADPSALFTRGLDGIVVASPPSTHLAIWNLAAGAGLPVFMEKPFALREELGRAASTARDRRLLMLDLNRRFWPPYQKIRALLRAGAVGEPESVDIQLHVDIKPWCSVTSHRRQSSEGGVLYDLGSQAIDLARWLTDRAPRQVSASSASHQWENDHVFVELEFEGGIRARCDLAYTERGRERVTINGRHGDIRLHDPNMAVHVGRAGLTGHSAWARGSDLAVLCYRGLRRSHSMMRFSVAAALAAFAKSIAGSRPFSPGFEDAAANAVCLDAAALALELGTAVTLDKIPT